jgi:hypothetical protein
VKTETETLQRVWYISSIDHTIRTLDKGRGDVIEQADEIPAVYDVVRGTRSKAWGKHSHHYLGCGRGDSPDNVLYRAGTLLHYAKLGRASELHGIPAYDMFGWSARFSIEHIRTKGLRGGLFQQFDGKYDRGCINLDYTPETLDEVITRFIGWCGATFRDPRGPYRPQDGARLLHAVQAGARTHQGRQVPEARQVHLAGRRGRAGGDRLVNDPIAAIEQGD